MASELTVEGTNSILEEYQMGVRMLKKVADQLYFRGPGNIEFKIAEQQLEMCPSVLDGIFMAYEQERHRQLSLQ